jgi:hypothetical protein
VAETTGVTIGWQHLSDLDTDATLAANSDTRIPTQKAVKAYVDAHAGGGGAIRRHTPTGAIDGANTSFVFSPAPSSPDGFFLLWNGLTVDPDDYSLDGGTVSTTGFTPKSGDKLYGIF